VPAPPAEERRPPSNRYRRHHRGPWRSTVGINPFLGTGSLKPGNIWRIVGAGGSAWRKVRENGGWVRGGCWFSRSRTVGEIQRRRLDAHPTRTNRVAAPPTGCQVPALRPASRTAVGSGPATAADVFQCARAARAVPTCAAAPVRVVQTGRCATFAASGISLTSASRHAPCLAPGSAAPTTQRATRDAVSDGSSPSRGSARSPAP
jgi:hypothetical protein